MSKKSRHELCELKYRVVDVIYAQPPARNWWKGHFGIRAHARLNMLLIEIEVKEIEKRRGRQGEEVCGEDKGRKLWPKLSGWERNEDQGG